MKHGDVAGELTRLTSFEAEQNVRRASLPEKPEAYKDELPGGFKLPEGVSAWEFDQSDPRLGALKQIAHSRQWDQGTYADVLGIYVKHELESEGVVKQARDAEIAKLGANGPARITALGTWLTAQLGDKQGKALLDRMVFSEDVEAMENIVKKFSSQGAAPFTGSHRTEPDPKPKTWGEKMWPGGFNPHPQQKKAS